jgi:hypothetical protein
MPVNPEIASHPAPTRQEAQVVDRTWRTLSAVLACTLAFTSAVMAGQALSLSDALLESELTVENVKTVDEFYAGSATRKTLTTVLFWASAATAALAAVLALLIAVTARFNRWLMPITGVALFLGVAGIVLSNV